MTQFLFWGELSLEIVALSTLVKWIFVCCNRKLNHVLMFIIQVWLELLKPVAKQIKSKFSSINQGPLD